MSDQHFDMEGLDGWQRQSLRVAVVASLLQVDISTIYKLVRGGSLEAHHIGKRGVRVFADSVRDYQEKGRIRPSRALPVRKKPRWRSFAQREALEVLRKNGVLD